MMKMQNFDPARLAQVAERDPALGAMLTRFFAAQKRNDRAAGEAAVKDMLRHLKDHPPPFTAEERAAIRAEIADKERHVGREVTEILEPAARALVEAAARAAETTMMGVARKAFRQRPADGVEMLVRGATTEMAYRSIVKALALAVFMAFEHVDHEAGGTILRTAINTLHADLLDLLEVREGKERE
jgi:hypothetical protein